MTDQPECTLCGLGLRDLPGIVWCDGEPFCSDRCISLYGAMEQPS
jgi:hypothetical protein